MRVIRPFEFDTLEPGQMSGWLLDPNENLGLGIRLRRGGGTTTISAVDGVERYALVLKGKATLSGPDGVIGEAAEGELIFVPSTREAAVSGDTDSIWAELEAPLPDDAQGETIEPTVYPVDPSKFEGGGFAYQGLVDRSTGSQSLRMNVLQVAPGAGSPDFHIHNFAQIYLIQEGELSLDIGNRREVARPNSLVVLPAGLVHRNFNASPSTEKHVSFLVPEPKEGEIFDFAVTIHPEEAEIMTAIPG